jgi:tetratricopeptide (TPR) repeat protein
MNLRRHALPVALLLLMVATVAAADLDEARDHKNHGRYDEAIAAYQAHLEANPGDQDARRELAQVSAWSKRYQEAIELYEQVLAADPEDDQAILGLARVHSWAGEFKQSLGIYDRYLERNPEDETIRLERAKVQSWSGDYGPVIGIYEAHLKGSPDDQKTRLELAKVLSWSGKLDRSITAYRQVLEAEPDNLEAQIGLARVLSWSGDHAAADARYDAILSGNPDHLGAQLGKTQLAMWGGNTRKAHHMLDELEAASPGNEEIARYRAELERYRQLVVQATYDDIDDSDGNDYRVTRVTATGHLTRFSTLTGIARRAETQLDARQATVHFVGLMYGISLPKGVELRVTGGVDFIDPSHAAHQRYANGATHTRLVGTVAAFGPVAGTWRWNVSAGHTTFDALREVVDNDIYLDSVQGGADGRWGKFMLGAAAGYTDFSDDNSRIHFTAYVLYPWELPYDVHIEAGYRYRYMDFDENLNNGYFDPSDFHSHLALFNARGPLFSPRWDWAVKLEAGWQSFEQDENKLLRRWQNRQDALITAEETDVDNDEIFGWEVRIGWDAMKRLRFEAYYGETDYALQSATGFDSEHWGLLARYRF